MNGKWFILAGLLLAVFTLLGCAGAAAIPTVARWACPSPMPKPYGPAGPIKDTRVYSADGELRTEVVYYEEWEQEYGDLGGPPFPSPTPFGLVGTSYVFGQRIELGPVHVTVSATPERLITRSDIPSDSQQLYAIHVVWVNHATEPLPFDYRSQVRLRAITQANGAVRSDSTWGMTQLALDEAGHAAPEPLIPPGESEQSIPILAPPGTPKTVDLNWLALPMAGTPAPNPELRSPGAAPLTIQWSNSGLLLPGAPTCGDAGALTNWDDAHGAWGQPVPVGLAAPPGAPRLIQVALNQVGKPYVWGAKGPERFDCSGLVSWSYGQIGIRILTGTAGQWPGMRPIDAAQLAPGDLVFFAIGGRGIDHVGMLLGDINGDGQWDMVHAANPELGVRTEFNVFGSAYYAPRIRGFRTAR